MVPAIRDHERAGRFLLDNLRRHPNPARPLSDGFSVWVLLIGGGTESPQVENGRTEIANELMEALAKFRIPGECWQVLAAILRKTYGWHKKADRIANSQLCELTGMHHGNVSRALSKLIRHQLVIKSDTGALGLQKQYSLWEPFGIKSDTVSKVIPARIKSDTDSVSKVTDTKAIKHLQKQPPTPKGESGGFDQFWEAYPNKKGKLAAQRAWQRIKGRPPLPAILQALDTQKRGEQWQRERGRFIPHPATWINQGRWDDETKPTTPAKPKPAPVLVEAPPPVNPENLARIEAMKNQIRSKLSMGHSNTVTT